MPSPAYLRSRYARGAGSGRGVAWLIVVIVLALASTGAGKAAVHTASHPAAHPAAPATASGSGSGSGGSGPTATEFIHLEEDQVGKPYIYGAIGPDAFDCSGLIFAELGRLGLDVGRTSEAQWATIVNDGDAITESQMEPGDLIFEQWQGDTDAPPGHVITYIGGGQVVEAPHTGAYVQIRAWSPYETQIIGYGRIPGLRY